MISEAQYKVRATLLDMIKDIDQRIESTAKSPFIDPEVSYSLNRQRHERELNYLEDMKREIRDMLEILNLHTK